MAHRWHTRSFRAMNTNVDLWCYGNDGTAGALVEAEQFFQEVERRMSRFDPTSELSRLNRAAGGAVRVSEMLYEVVELALAAAEATDGLFDPTLLSTLKAAGYDRSFDGVMATDSRMDRWVSRASTVTGGGFQHIRIWRNGQGPTVYLPKDVCLDLGGIAKGWTVDRVVDKIAPWGPCLVNAGGDLYAHATPPGALAWTVSVEDPLDAERDVAVLALRDCAVATSSRTKRCWTVNGRHQHHLIDPRRSQPAQSGLLSVSVVAPRVALAEIHTKTVFMLGAETGLAYLERQPQVAGLLVLEDGKLIVSVGMRDHAIEIQET